MIATSLVAFAACGGGSSAATKLEHDVRGYTAAFGTGDGRSAWSTVSQRCKAQTNETDFRATVAAAGVKYAGLHVVDYAAEIDGKLAKVTYTTSSPEIGPYRAQRWVLEGSWRWDGC